MVLIRLTYFSRIRLHGPINDHLDDILVTSVANNRRDDITGVLVHDGRWFAQMLEGRESIVSATFERILCDWRHSDVSLVSMHPVAERRFADWWMRRIAYGADNSDLFRHYGENDHFDPQQMRVDRLRDLIEELADRPLGGPSWTTSRTTNAA
jgi:hypothetical protein